MPPRTSSRVDGDDDDDENDNADQEEDEFDTVEVPEVVTTTSSEAVLHMEAQSSSDEQRIRVSVDVKKKTRRASPLDRLLAGYMHKVHVLSYLAFGLARDCLCDDADMVQAAVACVLPSDLLPTPSQVTPGSLKGAVHRLSSLFTITVTSTGVLLPSLTTLRLPISGRLSFMGRLNWTARDLQAFLTVDSSPEAAAQKASVAQTNEQRFVSDEVFDRSEWASVRPSHLGAALVQSLASAHLDSLSATLALVAYCRQRSVPSRIVVALSPIDHRALAKTSGGGGDSGQDTKKKYPFPKSKKKRKVDQVDKDDFDLIGWEKENVRKRARKDGSTPQPSATSPTTTTTTTTTTTATTTTVAKSQANETAQGKDRRRRLKKGGTTHYNDDDNDDDDDGDDNDDDDDDDGLDEGESKEEGRGRNRVKKENESDSESEDDDDARRGKKRKKGGGGRGRGRGREGGGGGGGGKERQVKKARGLASSEPSDEQLPLARLLSKEDEAWLLGDDGTHQGGSDDGDAKNAKERNDNEVYIKGTTSKANTKTGGKQESATATTFAAEKQTNNDRSNVSTPSIEWTFVWAEVYSPLEKRWIPVDVARRLVDTPDKFLIPNLAYVVAFESGRMRDVTHRYTFRWSEAMPLRMGPWWEETLSRLSSHFDQKLLPPGWQEREEEEDNELDSRTLIEPLPTAQSAFKNHPLYALPSLLNSSQTVYPVGQVVGHFKGEAVVPRECVQEVRSKYHWNQAGRDIKEGEKPAKLVTKTVKGVPRTTEMFGVWQTLLRARLVATDGIVPKTERGDVELWNENEELLPIGTTWLQVNGLKGICRQLGVDFADAFVGFDHSRRGVVPRKLGIVVCTEVAQLVMEAASAVVQKNREEARVQRTLEVIERWKRMVLRLLIRERVKSYYAENEQSSASGVESSRADTSESPAVTPSNIVALNGEGSGAVATPLVSVLRSAHVHEWGPSHALATGGGLCARTCVVCGFTEEYEEL